MYGYWCTETPGAVSGTGPEQIDTLLAQAEALKSEGNGHVKAGAHAEAAHVYSMVLALLMRVSAKFRALTHHAHCIVTHLSALGLRLG